MIIKCRICKGPARLIYQGFPGYIEGTAFDIAQCDVCDVAFVTKPNNTGFIYDSIYAHAPTLQGYSRYPFYAEQVLREKDPLSFLGESEECYWAVAQLVDYWVNKNRRKPRILEIGCGYGYTTYALRRHGYEATGMDISSNAVQQARDRYGNYFQCCDMLELAEANTEICDIMVMTELIEHVEDPARFLAQAAKLLRGSGILIVTTPNKAEAPADAVWETELPPVHLWWFTEASMRQIGRHGGLQYEATDLTEYYQKYRKLTQYYLKSIKCRPTRGNTSTANGMILPRSILRPDGTPQQVVVIARTLRLRRRFEWVFRCVGISCWMQAVEWRLRGLEKYRHYGKSGPCLCGFYSKA
jgi:SAM-dependent methyltransferase